VRVEILYVDGCPHYAPLLRRVRSLAAADEALELVVHRIGCDEDARIERFLGSPTVRVDGRDIEPGAESRTDYGMKCRLYRRSTGVSGEAPEDLLRAALTAGSEA
jgi:hypothetical protein